MIIRARNLLDQQANYTYLSNGEAASGTALRVKNINSFAANWAVQVGKTGEETTEILKLGTATVSGTALNTAGTLKYSHPADTPIYAIKYDQFIFKVSTSGTAGTATAITDGTVNITADSDYTLFDHTTGLSTYAYKVSYYNSVLADESTDSDWITPTGFTFYSLAKLRQRIKSKLFDSSYITDDGTYDDWVNEWLEKMNTSANKLNKDYGLGTTAISFSSDGLGTITDSNFVDIRKVEVTYDGGVSYKVCTKIELTDFSDNDTYSSALPHYYFKGDSVIGMKPEESGGTARIIYTTIRTVLTNDTDELPVVMRPYSRSFVNYGVSQAYYNDHKTAEGDRYLAMAEKDRLDFISEITPRSKSGVQTIQVIEGIDGDDNNYIEVF